MRALWLGAAMAAIGVGPARADEAPRGYPPGYTPVYAPAITYDWTGFYFGGQVGADNARTRWPNDLTFEKVEQSTTGFIGGVHAGVQKQWSWIVLGAEVSYLWMDQSGSVASATVPGVTLGSTVRNLTLVTGKFGWTWENLLATFRGGWATGEVDFRITSTAGGTLPATSSEREGGWTAGASIEYALWDHVILGAEYDYVQFNVNPTLAPGAGALAPIHLHAAVNVQSVTARLTFKFGGGAVAIK